MIDKQKAIAALEAHQGQYKGLSASVVAGCIQVIRELPEEDILNGEELAEVACALNLLKDYKNIGAADRLRELVQAEKDGRLVVLPCKVGTPVWWIETVIKSNGRGKWVTVKHVRPDEFCYAMLGWIDTPIYLTREEAEAALEARKGGESDA